MLIRQVLSCLYGVLIRTDTGVNLQHKQGVLGGAWILYGSEKVAQDQLAQTGLGQ